MSTVTTSELVEVLNDLIKINNDRIAGYEKAVEEVKSSNVDLHGIFLSLADASRKNIAELTQQIHSLGGESETGTTGMGKVYRAWMDIKSTFASNDRLSVLESCEYGEDAAQKAYDDALASDTDMDTETRQLITSQKKILKDGHDTVKRYRDNNKSSL